MYFSINKIIDKTILTLLMLTVQKCTIPDSYICYDCIHLRNVCLGYSETCMLQAPCVDFVLTTPVEMFSMIFNLYHIYLGLWGSSYAFGNVKQLNVE